MTAPPSAFERFRALHRAEGALILPTAWDAASARIMEAAGARAVGTAGSAIAHLLGFRDGDDHLPLDSLLRMTSVVVGATSLPVTGDLGGGYDDPGGSVARILETGVVGINLTDRSGPGGAIRPVAESAAAVATARREAEAAAVELTINARTDTLDCEGSVEEAIERANAYLAVGADCVLVAGAGSLPVVERLVEGIAGPLNIAVRAGFPAVTELEAAGVRRISVTFAGAMWSGLSTMATGLIEGRSAAEMDARAPFPPLDKWFAEDLSRGSNRPPEGA